MIIEGDVREVLAGLLAESVHCVVTSPPYWRLRDYGVAGQIGLEETPTEYVAAMVDVFREVRRVLRPEGTLWLNIGDSYAVSGCGSQGKNGLRADRRFTAGMPRLQSGSGLKPKDLCLIPARLAIALQDDGWWVRSDNIWAKTNPMPSSAHDRTTLAHEYFFMLTKSEDYFFDDVAIMEPASPTSLARTRRAWNAAERTALAQEGVGGKAHTLDPAKMAPAMRNKRSVWTISTEASPEAHFATFPQKLVEPCILAGTSEHGCCPEYGAPWKRLVERSGGTTGKGWHDHQDDEVRGARIDHPHGKGGTDDGYQVHTVGWAAGCDHLRTPVPCTILDPFCGSGQAGIVAARLDRDFIGIELNPEYVAMSERRIAPFEAKRQMVLR